MKNFKLFTLIAMLFIVSDAYSAGGKGGHHRASKPHIAGASMGHSMSTGMRGMRSTNMRPMSSIQNRAIELPTMGRIKQGH